MSNTQVSAFSSLVAAAIGQLVLQSTEGADPVKFKIAKLDDKLGKLKDGSEAQYVVLTREDDEAVVVQLHPKRAKNLIEKGVDGEYSMVKADEGTSTEQAADTGTTDQPVEATGNEGASEQTAEATAQDELPSKKDISIEVFCEMIGTEGVARKDIINAIIAKVKEVRGEEMSKACAQTYYQNCASYKDGWTVDPDAPEAEQSASDTGTSDVSAEESAAEAGDETPAAEPTEA